MFIGWSTETKQIALPVFTESPGPTIPVSRSPIEMFKTFCSDDLIDNIVLETNRYHQQTSNSPDFETSAEEMNAYLGFMILMGMCRLPEIRDYWAKSDQLHYTAIASKISRFRFEAMTRNIHFADNDHLPLRRTPGYDKLQKVQPIINYLKTSFLTSYIPHQQASIDEAMIQFKGTQSLQLPSYNDIHA